MQKIFREIKQQIIIENRCSLDFPAHIHEDIELVYVKKGVGVACCDGKKYVLSDNSFFLVFPNQVHHYSQCEGGEYIVLIIKPSELLGYNNIFEKGVPACALWSFEKENDENAPYLIEIAVKEFEQEGQSTIIKAYLTALFGKLFKHYNVDKSRVTNDTVLRVLQYCSENYKYNITVNTVANNLNISRSSVSHIFSSRLSMNFCDYINSLRLTDAVNMLKNKNYSITEISYMCGFSTIRTFNRAFSKRYGISPSFYRKHNGLNL